MGPKRLVRGKEQTKEEGDSEDIWVEIKAEVSTRLDDHVDILWSPSHIDIEEAQEMTRQHYEFLTDEVLPFMASPSSIEEVADKLGDTNPLFNRGVFMARALEKWEQKNIPQAMIEEVTS